MSRLSSFVRLNTYHYSVGTLVLPRKGGSWLRAEGIRRKAQGEDKLGLIFLPYALCLKP